MALVREVTSLDEVPEYARAGYKQVGDKWVNEDIEDTLGLKGALKKERDGRKADREAIEKEMAPFRELGMTAEEIATLKAEVAKKREQGGSEQDVEKLLAKRQAEWKEKELTPVVAERDALRAENRKLLLTDQIRAAFIAAGGIEDDADDVVRLYEDQFDLGERNPKTGKPKILVKDEDGDPTGQSPQEWFEKVLKSRKPKYFKGTGAAGGGTAPSGPGGSGDAEVRKLSGSRMVESAFAGGKTK